MLSTHYPITSLLLVCCNTTPSLQVIPCIPIGIPALISRDVTLTCSEPTVISIWLFFVVDVVVAVYHDEDDGEITA